MGVKTFMIDYDGIVYENDLGQHSHRQKSGVLRSGQDGSPYLIIGDIGIYENSTLVGTGGFHELGTQEKALARCKHECALTLRTQSEKEMMFSPRPTEEVTISRKDRARSGR
jgi:Protein of unknown function (DUF2950)